MWPDQVLNPGPLALESDALLTALRSPALNRESLSPQTSGFLKLFTSCYFYKLHALVLIHRISAPDKKGKRDNLGIIFHITPLKHML